MPCPSCGTPNPTNASFCGSCGARIPKSAALPVQPRRNAPFIAFAAVMGLLIGVGGAFYFIGLRRHADEARVVISAPVAAQSSGSGSQPTAASSDQPVPSTIEDTSNTAQTSTEPALVKPVANSDGSKQPSPSPPAPLSLPSMSDRLLTISDLAGKSAFELDVMRNEPYARRGFVFERTDIARYYAQFPWYHGAVTDQNVIWKQMSHVERLNAAFIRNYEMQHGMVRARGSIGTVGALAH